MNTDSIKGIIVPLITPIDENQIIDEARLRRIVDHVIEDGVHGILAYGSNSEFYCVEEEEMKRGLRIILDQTKGRVPVLMGIGAIHTPVCVRIAKWAVEMGADAISVLQPMFLKPTEEQLYRHFKTIAEAVPDKPMLLYNNPGRVGYTLSAKLVTRLAHTVPNIVGVKDTSGDMTLTTELIRQNRDIGFKVFGGKDTLVFATLVSGGAGAVCSTANMVGPLVCSIYEKYMAGDIDGAREAQFKLNPIRLSMDLASFPTGTKDLANLLGLDMGDPYLPNTSTTGEALETMRQRLIEGGYTVVK
ncbi:MAG: dihydrodipicolinate synthase family protein [Oscillospiraceae bacterium]|nr:MAG: dihydrodipicolinate synthase family protein [Oscillospiraceae bacterium]